MKKILFFAAVFATALVSCSSDENEVVAPENPTTTTVQSLGIKTAGTTMSIKAGAKSRTVAGNTAEIDANNVITVTLAPVMKSEYASTTYTLGATGYSLKANPWKMNANNEKKSLYGNIYANIDSINKPSERIAVSASAGNVSLTITDLSNMFNETNWSDYFMYKTSANTWSTYEGLAGSTIDEWTYEVYLYPEVVSSETLANGSRVINCPLADINNADYEWANLIGGAPFIDRDAHDVKDAAGNVKWHENAYKEATPLVVDNANYKVRVMAYQGYCHPTVNNAGGVKENNITEEGYSYTYDYGYIKVSIHVSKK